MKHLAVFRYSDVPGMIGKVGTVLGEHGINVASTAVGREPDHEPDSPAGGGSGRHAVMVVTVDSPIPDEVIREILSLEGSRTAAPSRSSGGQRPGDRARSLLRLEDRRDAEGRRARGTIVRRDAPPDGPDVVIVDLDNAAADVGLPAGMPRLGFYSHVDVETKRRAEEAGFELVVPRSRMAREMPDLVAALLK